MITLYEFTLSGHCHKVRLMLSLLDLEYRSVIVDSSKQQHQSAEFLAMNPFGQLPILTDGEVTVRDSQAILVYLANKFGGSQWWPEAPEALAQVMAWLSTAANEVSLGPNRLRLHYKFGRTIDMEESGKTTITLLRILEARFESHQFLATDDVSIADIAVYPYIALAPEGKIDLSEYPAVTAWLGRIQALPGYVHMPGMWQS